MAHELILSESIVKGWLNLTSHDESSEVRWSVGDMVLASAICLGAFGLFLLVVGGVTPADRWERDISQLAWLAALAETVLLIAVWLIIVRKHGLPWTAVGLRLPVRRKSFVFAAAALFGSLAFTASYAFAASTLGFDLLVPEQLPPGLAGDGAFMLLTALALGVWVPFVEEVFFRGFLFAGLAARYGLHIGVAVSAALFSLVHFSAATIIPIFVTGVLFALVYHVTRSIWVPMIAHSAQNLIALFASQFALPEVGSRVGEGLGVMTI